MSSQWAAKRKLTYGIIVIAVIIVFVGVPLFLFFYKTPTCFDGKKNQNEKGLDCGGVCAKICSSDISAPIVMWQRVFEVTPGVYNAVAYIQNPNVLNYVNSAEYIFKLYDKDNTLITQKLGRTFLPANKTFAIFESGIRTGARIPVRASFEFIGSLSWIQNPVGYKEPSVVVENIVLTNDMTYPRINALIHNLSLDTIKTLGAVAIIYDADDNAIAVSRTVVENLLAQSSIPVTFTWPTQFSSSAVRKEIILQIYPTGIAL